MIRKSSLLAVSMLAVVICPVAADHFSPPVGTSGIRSRENLELRLGPLGVRSETSLMIWEVVATLDSNSGLWEIASDGEKIAVTRDQVIAYHKAKEVSLLKSPV